MQRKRREVKREREREDEDENGGAGLHLQLLSVGVVPSYLLDVRVRNSAIVIPTVLSLCFHTFTNRSWERLSKERLKLNRFQLLFGHSGSEDRSAFQNLL